MSNEEIVRAVVTAFDSSDNETILSHMAHDVQWLMLGSSTISGKEGMRTFFDEHPEIKILSITKDNFIFDGDIAVVNGEASCSGAGDKVYNMFYCDIYELQNSKVKKLTSYTVDKR